MNNRIGIVDCTLRDGGYVNKWEFGKENIKKIIEKLVEANIDIVECGFLTEKDSYNEECSKFDTFKRVSEFLPMDKKSTQMVCMINYGEYKLENIPSYNPSLIDGIRVAFHKNDIKGALELCKGLKKKGYKVFIQPMVSLSYTDLEFLNLINETNKIEPEAFYIVDSFGVMKKNDLLRFFYLVDKNLKSNIKVGYHSHNNLQLSFSNAQALTDIKTKRQIYIDSSVFGMGRGAGNLNTELFIEYLNTDLGNKYKIKPLMQIIDKVLNNIYLSNSWGYSLPHYISAMNNCHPNYASHLTDKSTLTIEDIDNILGDIKEEKKNSFDKSYIEDLYCSYQAHNIDDRESLNMLKEIFENKKVVVIAPGSSILTEEERVEMACGENETLTISINFVPENIEVNYVFVSNIRRFEEIENKEKLNLITTSNITDNRMKSFVVNYISLLNEIDNVKDNAGLMILQLLMKLGVGKVMLAGYDGYSYDANTNYADKDMAYVKRKEVVDSLNAGISEMINEYSGKLDIEFITKTKYLKR